MPLQIYSMPVKHAIPATFSPSMYLVAATPASMSLTASQSTRTITVYNAVTSKHWMSVPLLVYLYWDAG